MATYQPPRYQSGSSSPNTRRGTHSPHQDPIQPYQSVESPVETKPIPVTENYAASQQLANEQLGAHRASVSATVATNEGNRTVVVDASHNDTAEPPAAADYDAPIEDCNWLDNNVCTVIIGDGDKGEKISVHEKLILHKSPYFRRILKASNKPELGEIFLKDVSVPLFKLLLRWMYGTALGRVFRYNAPDNDVSIHDYIGLYVLASQLEMPAAKNCIMDTIFNYYTEDVPTLRCPAIADLRMVLDNLPADSPLERLLLAHLLFACFSPKRGDAPVPDDWRLIATDGRIGHGLVIMLTEWKWLLGRNVPPMKIRDRLAFHEKVEGIPVSARTQPRVVIKDEPGTGTTGIVAPPPPVAQGRRPHREPVVEQDYAAIARAAAKRPAAAMQYTDAEVRAAKRQNNGRKGGPGGGGRGGKVHQANGSPDDPISL